MLYTVGHSTRPIDEFVSLLHEFGVEVLADIRTVPKSRRNPQFHQDELSVSLPAAGIEYRHLAGLGGLRRPVRDSPNGAWRNDSFRGYADYMGTPSFEAALGELIDLSTERVTAIMCAEAVYWRCHRSLVADALLVRGVDVRHIMGPGSVKPARLTSFAHVDGTRVVYPPED
ncbi:DNA repair protein [Mycobacterium sp. Soil538]|nr:DNA repair protein [Mycobacterium sp. Soil538]